MARGPLDHPRLRAIEQRLDAGDLDEAQRLLVEFGDVAVYRSATAYLATRLLFQRGRLDLHGFIERLRDLLRMTPDFPEARALLEPAEKGLIAPGRGKTSTIIDESAAEKPAPPPSRRSASTVPNIPRAPLVPSFTPPPDVRPSYAPDHVPPPAPPPPDEAQPPTAREPRARGDSAHAIPDLSPAPAEMEPGRYARRPTAAVEVVRTRPSSSNPPTVSKPVGRRQQPHVRSRRPPADEDDPPSLAGVATLLDEGRFERALELLEATGIEGAERSILHARSLLGAGRRAQAQSVVERLTAQALEAESRAAVARLWLDLGEAERALPEAERAQQADERSPMVELTLAWALVRVAWRRDDTSLVARAEQLLRAFKGRDSPMPALVQALRACVQAKVGDPERAIGAAQRALGLDARSIDALVALAIAATRLGRQDEARQAVRDLRHVSAAEADAIAPTLTRLGLSVPPAEL